MVNLPKCCRLICPRLFSCLIQCLKTHFKSFLLHPPALHISYSISVFPRFHVCAQFPPLGYPASSLPPLTSPHGLCGCETADFYPLKVCVGCLAYHTPCWWQHKPRHVCLPCCHASVAGHMLTTAWCLEPTAMFLGHLLSKVKGLMSGSEGALMFSFWIRHSALKATENLLTPSLTVSPWDCNYDVQKQNSRQHKLLWYCAFLFPVQRCCCCSSAGANWAILGRIHLVPRAHGSQGHHKATPRMCLVM